MILAAGYRVRTSRGTQFRWWANQPPIPTPVSANEYW